ncbi:hypothetical protein CSV71_04095 [Sporosarcina sp. P21c]|nr:hypothetical protein CSV78_06185 [Sporosarcina sp. P16a]PIC83924.1 hypothetical protein CSV73_06060 [Sporosarcina sp. P1]PIC90775.1 hypothetical protein CSV71_04095 [Sporosarcina sp. P21c]PIC93541.1 hypothetical protein CSV70_06050 [Sporosarcina sp. P25]
MILFGSYTEGTTHVDSDRDLAYLSNKEI